jgi:hypothetical protein
MLMSSPLVLLDEDEAGWWVLLEAIVGQHLNMSGTVEEVGGGTGLRCWCNWNKLKHNNNKETKKGIFFQCQIFPRHLNLMDLLSK